MDPKPLEEWTLELQFPEIYIASNLFRMCRQILNENLKLNTTHFKHVFWCIV